jgi:glycosyltransferase involved in cell wall biosynthesis
VVITAHNRGWCVERAMRSACAFLLEIPWRRELVVIDDASQDNTAEVVTKTAEQLRAAVPCTTIRLMTNLGVCGAKNRGVVEATGAWVMFLDSDDEMIAANARRCHEVITGPEARPAMFFWTIGDQDPGATPAQVHRLTLNLLIRQGTLGRDAVPLMRRELKLRYPYETGLNGYEGICYQRIAKELGSIPLVTLPIIQVHTGHADRLSAGQGLARRRFHIARGHHMALREHWADLEWRSRIVLLLKLGKSWLAGCRYAMLRF